MIDISGDLSPITEYAQMAESFGRILTSEQTLSQTVKALTRSAAAGFGNYVDKLAIANPLHLHHVYEWGHVGDPLFRLFDLKSVGHGKTRSLFFLYKASKVPVMTGLTRAEDDTRKNVHIFYWKAPVMESGESVDVRITDKEYLVFPRGQHGAIDGDSKGSMTFYPRDIVVQNPGGAETTGQFMFAWETYWRTAVNEVVTEDFTLTTEKTLQTELPMLLTKINSSRRLPYRFGIQTAPRRNMRPYAQAAVDALVGRYLNAARVREGFGGGHTSDI